jgi:hypothetical protein
MEIRELNASIFKGLRNAHKDSSKFNGFINPSVKPEYLLTVNVAQSISSDFEIRVKLEESTERIKRESADKLDVLNYFDYLHDLKAFAFLEKLREGRIDIVLYEFDNSAVYPIEIKGFDSALRNKQVIYADIDRILIFLSDTTGKSKIKAGCVVFIQELKPELTSGIPESIKNIESDYQSLISLIYNDKLDTFKFEVCAEPIFDNLFESDEEIGSYNTDSFDQIGLADVVDEKGLYAGIIVNIVKKQN